MTDKLIDGLGNRAVGTRPDGCECFSGAFVRGIDAVDKDGRVIGRAPYRWVPEDEFDAAEDARRQSGYLRSGKPAS